MVQDANYVVVKGGVGFVRVLKETIGDAKVGEDT